MRDRATRDQHGIITYFRYEDDIVIVTRPGGHTKRLIDKMNSLAAPDWRIEHESSSTAYVNVLDVTFWMARFDLYHGIGDDDDGSWPRQKDARQMALHFKDAPAAMDQPNDLPLTQVWREGLWLVMCVRKTKKQP